MNKGLTLEHRISCLEKLVCMGRMACKNETFGVDFKPGNLVEDVDGYTAEVVDLGTLGDLWDDYQLDLCDNNMEQIMDYMDEDPDWRSLTKCVIVRYDDTSDMEGGDCAIWIDPENSLDLIGDRRDDGSELLFKRECNNEWYDESCHRRRTKMDIAALESRITCLENRLIGKSILKNESMDSRLRRELSNIFNNFCNDYFDSDRELVSNMQRLASYSNDSMVDDAIIWLSDNTSRDTDELENYRGEIEDYLAEWASDFMQDMRRMQ